MNPAVKYLSQCKTFFLANIEDGKPRVRPFGAVMEWEGKPYLCTNNQKNVYQQLLKNPYIQICGLLENWTWVRVSGKAIPDHRREARVAMMEACPGLDNMYQPDDKLFEVLYIEDAVTEIATFHVNGYIMNRVEE